MHPPPTSANLITQKTWEASEGGTSQEVSIPVPACVFMCSCEVTASWAWGRDADVAEAPSPAGMLGRPQWAGLVYLRLSGCPWTLGN